MSAEYKIESLRDLLNVPMERRRECLRQLEYALALHEFAVGSAAGIPTRDFVMVWLDDGDRTIDYSLNGEPLLTMEVTDNGPPA